MPRSVSLPQTVDAVDFRLLNEWQRDFPCVSRPFARIGEAVGLDEDQVIAAYRRMQGDGLVSRVGAVFAPRRLGASALAALAAPIDRLEEVAARVSSETAINHNYQREHHYNLWFVLTGPHRQHLQQILDELEKDTGLTPLDLPMLTAYRVDLGFSLGDQP